MNHFSKLSILAVILASSFVFEASAATSTDCGYLGYKKEGTISCDPSDMIRCPADTSMVFCKTAGCVAVPLGANDVCTESCATDANVCIAKREGTCNEIIKAQNNQALIVGPNEDIKTIDAREHTQAIYIKGNVSAAPSGYKTQLSFNNITIHDAHDIPKCKEEGVTKGYLTIPDILLKQNVSFNVDVHISTARFDSGIQNPFSYFDHNTTIDSFATSKCSSMGCQVATLYFSDPTTNTVHFGHDSFYDQGDIYKVVASVASGAKLNYIYESGVEVECVISDYGSTCNGTAY